MSDPRIVGTAAEDLAARHLAALGYTLVTRRYRTVGGEIDLVALDGPVLVFAEVKARPSREAAAEAVGRTKIERMAKAADRYLAEQGGWRGLTRFDLLLVTPDGAVEHLIDAFRAEPRPTTAEEESEEWR